MNKVSFPTIKLGNHIKQITLKVKNSDVIQDALIVYGVTNTDGIAITNNKASDDLGNYIILGENQFAYNPYRINVGSIGLSKERQSGVVSPAYVVFECLDSIDSEFLLYYLKSSLGINLIKWYGDRGGVRSALRFSDLKNIDFPAIDIQQQKQILNKIKSLDKYLSELNSLLNETEIANLRQSILQQAIEGKLVPQDSNDEPASALLKKIKAEKEQLIKEKKIKKQKDLPPIKDEEKPFELPQGWEWCRLGEISNISSGSTPETSKTEYYTNGTIPWLTSSATGNDFINSSNNHITLKALEDCSLTLYEKGTLIMAMYGQGKTRGQITELLIEATTNQACAAINLFYSYNSYIKLYCKSIYNAIRELAHGGNQPNLNSSKIKSYLIPLPPLAEQQRIVEKVDILMALCDELEQEVKTAKKYASQLMEAVLQEAFTEDTPTLNESNSNIVEFPIKKVSEKDTLLALAARGTMKQETWEKIVDSVMDNEE